MAADETADACLQEPKLRKMGQALLIPAGDYRVLTRHRPGAGDDPPGMQKRESACCFLLATAGCPVSSCTNQS